MKNYTKISIVVVLYTLGMLGIMSRMSHSSLASGLPVYQAFQLVNPNGMGAVMSNGIATSTLMGSSTPTFAGITATSSIQLTTASGGCAQFGVTGLLTSVGSNCTTGGGKTMDMYAATSSNSGGNSNYAISSTTSITSGNTMLIWGRCTSPNNNTSPVVLEVHNPGGGTTTVDIANTSNGSSGTRPSNSVFGKYTATTTGLLFVAIDDGVLGKTAGTGAATLGCQDSSFIFQRFIN